MEKQNHCVCKKPGCDDSCCDCPECRPGAWPLQIESRTQLPICPGCGDSAWSPTRATDTDGTENLPVITCTICGFELSTTNEVWNRVYHLREQEYLRNQENAGWPDWEN